MPYDARVFQILIASPGDVQDERDILADIIHEWNYVNSRDRRIVLLPLRWETHSSPEMGSRPQAVINRQVVDQCDLAIGVFWTRLGTPSAKAESGTAEEIARVGDAGKPVMVYFSKAKVDVDSLDLDEYMRLRDFKAKTYPQGLMAHYSSLTEFRETFTRQLALKMREIIAQDSAIQGEEAAAGARSQSEVPLSLAFAASGTTRDRRPSNKLQLKKIVCVDEEQIPDFSPAESEVERGAASQLRIGGSNRKANKNYYRELVRYYIQKEKHKSLLLAVTNTSDHGIADVYMEVSATIAGDCRIFPFEGSRARPEPYTSDFGYVSGSTFINFGPTSGHLRVSAESPGRVSIEVDFPVVQSRRTVFSANEFSVEAEDDCAITFDATVYSSDLTPFATKARLEVNFVCEELGFQEILDRISR